MHYSELRSIRHMPPSEADLRHLPPHLREVCQILAAGLLRLGRYEKNMESDGHGHGESWVHSTAGQSVHAHPLDRSAA